MVLVMPYLSYAYIFCRNLNTWTFSEFYLSQQSNDTIFGHKESTVYAKATVLITFHYKCLLSSKITISFVLLMLQIILTLYVLCFVGMFLVPRNRMSQQEFHTKTKPQQNSDHWLAVHQVMCLDRKRLYKLGTFILTFTNIFKLSFFLQN